MDKLERIKTLSTIELKVALMQMLKAIKFEKIEEKENYIVAIEKSSFTEIKHLFVISHIQLSGSVGTNEFLSIIENIQNSESANVVTIVSQHYISKGFRDSANSKMKQIKLDYIGRDDLIRYIDKYNASFWRHGDAKILTYEQNYRNQLQSENQLKKLHLSSDKFQQLLNIYASSG